MNPPVGSGPSRVPPWCRNSCLGSHDEGIFENYMSACCTLECDTHEAGKQMGNM
jgi:hypothetical protein